MGHQKTIRWGVIGLGWFGEIHAETLADMPGIELAAVCTRRPQRLAEVADRFGVPKRYTDYRDLLADPVDRRGRHHHAHQRPSRHRHRRPAERQARVPGEADGAHRGRLRSDPRGGPSRRRGFFMVGHICRFDPRVALAKQAIDEGRIGKIVSMHARRNLSKTIGRARCWTASPP